MQKEILTPNPNLSVNVRTLTNITLTISTPMSNERSTVET